MAMDMNMCNYPLGTCMVEFVIHEYVYEYNKVFMGTCFAGMNMQYPYPLPDGYQTCGYPYPLSVGKLYCC